MSKKPSKNQHPKKTNVKKQPIAITAPKVFPVWIAVIIFAVTTLFFFWDQITGDKYFWEDFTEYVYPVQSFAASESANGYIPFWNPYTFLGMPFYADLQVGFFYPANRILTLFADPDGALPVGILQFMIILHFLIAQIAMYLLARWWKVSSYGALIAGVSYGFSMMLVCHVIHPMIIYHLAWLPLVVMFFHKAMKNRSIKNGVISGLLLGMAMLSGHPQMTLYAAFFLGLMFIWYLIANLKKKELQGGNLARFIIAPMIAFVIGTGIFAVQFLPSQELAGLSQRKEMTYEAASEGSLQLKQLYTAISPKLFGYVSPEEQAEAPYYLQIDTDQGEQPAPYYYYWESAFYFGIAALILGIFGAWITIRQRKTAFLTFALVFGILFSMGSNFIIFPLFYELALFGTFRNPSRMMFWAVFALSVLAGIGFDNLWNYSKKVLLKLIIPAGVIALISLLISSGAIPSALDAPQQAIDEVQGFGILAFFLTLGVFIAAFLVNRGIVKPAAGGAIIFILAFIDLYIAGASFNASPQNPEEAYQLNPQIKQMLKPNQPEDIFRVNMRMYQPYRVQAMKRNQGMIDRIMLMEGYNPLILERVSPPVTDRLEKNRLSNVRYQIEVSQQQGAYFSEREEYYPRAWMVYNYEVLNEAEIKNRYSRGNYDFRETVYLEDDPGLELGGKPASEPEIRFIEYNSNSFGLSVKSDKPGILCLNEIWYPAWNAYVDGKNAEVYQANYCFRAIEFPAGEHIVEMRYESGTFIAGMWISIITLIASAALLVFFRKDQYDKEKK